MALYNKSYQDFNIISVVDRITKTKDTKRRKLDSPDRSEKVQRWKSKPNSPTMRPGYLPPTRDDILGGNAAPRDLRRPANTDRQRREQADRANDSPEIPASDERFLCSSSQPNLYEIAVYDGFGRRQDGQVVIFEAKPENPGPQVRGSPEDTEGFDDEGPDMPAAPVAMSLVENRQRVSSDTTYFAYFAAEEMVMAWYSGPTGKIQD
ncbi:hypothetical protein LAZ67_3006253 [Cordylochernes scorpioides]|uniref:Uncharacterized protein n=1 Tax=Cordylochernes scorpioides TaxID=51811 RepID=A0ABY6KEG3_9ARAC|nr:hypothetical protein LAZ67_3006253 [Cordylochernes scorpioides]